MSIKAFRLFLLLNLLLSSFRSLAAQDTTATQNKKLLIGITPTATFVMKDQGQYTGLSIKSWQMVNEDLE
ncbi:MAG: ligand-gated ion channel family protein, partial [Salinimicrobium sp.]